MDIYTPSIDVQKWFPDKSDLTKWVYDIIKYLHDTPIPTEEDVAKAVDAYLAENPITGNFYSADNPPPYPVTSVNGKTGAVTVPGFAVSPAKPITPTNINTDNVTLTLSGYTQGKYKMIFVLFDCHSSNKDTGIALHANTANVTLYSGISDYDGGQYDFKVGGVICYPTALDDGGVLSLVASDGGAQIYTAQEANYWWGVE